MVKHMKHRATFVVLGSLGLLLGGCGKEAPAKPVSYNTDIKPVLDKKCAACHLPGGEGFEKTGLRLDGYGHLHTGTKLGAVVVPGSSVSSTLYLTVSGKTHRTIHMPKQGEPLSEQEVALLKRWIDEGAKNN
jgi:hypothetical protein